MGSARVIALVSLLLAASGLVHCSLRNLDGLAENDESSSGGTNTGGSSGTPTTNGSSGTGVPDASSLSPSKVQCATTNIVCDITSAQCCVTYSGEDSAATRSLDSSSAKCQSIGGGCGQFISTGDTFTNQIAQRCSTAANCSGQACCVLPMEEGQRLSKNLGSIQCLAAADCNTKGRIICVTSSDCPANTTCLPETDPILSRFYGSFCR